MTDMSLSDSDLSSLSSAPPTDDESIVQAVEEPVGIQKYFKKGPSPESPPPPKRPASPPHEYVLADNPDIAVSIGSPMCYSCAVCTFSTRSCVPPRACLPVAFPAVHRHVPRAFPRRVPPITTTLRSPGHRERSCRYNTWRSYREVTMRITGPGVEPEKGC